MGKYIFKGGTFDKGFSTACNALFHFNKWGVLQGSADGKDYGSVPLSLTELVTATSKTLTPADNGKHILYGSLTSGPINLPKASYGKMRFSMSIHALPTSGVGARFVPATGDSIVGCGLTGTAGQNVGCAAAGDALGDWIELVSNGDKTWHIIRRTGTWTLAI
jgi:hypothetical protein